jgi:hypothetical protein
MNSSLRYRFDMTIVLYIFFSTLTLFKPQQTLLKWGRLTDSANFWLASQGARRHFLEHKINQGQHCIAKDFR